MLQAPIAEIELRVSSGGWVAKPMAEVTAAADMADVTRRELGS